MIGDKKIRLRYEGKIGSFAFDFAFETPMQGIHGITGPSGAGKTTLLRAMAGLEHIQGRLALADTIWQDDAKGIFLPPHRRTIGYVFQEPSLFSHLSVRDNLRYGYARARRKRVNNPIPSAPIAFDDIVAFLDIRKLLDIPPSRLSGGERQRIAIGRALLCQPSLLLMDEPLSALDRAAKDELLPYLEMLRDRLSLPIFYVSHDISEIERLADHLIYLEKGRVAASGPLSRLQIDPALPFFRAPNAAVTLEGIVSSFDSLYSLSSLTIPGGVLTVSGFQGKIGEKRRLRIKASDVSFSLIQPKETTILNCLPARLLSIEPQDASQTQMNLIAGLGEDGTGAPILGRITRKSQESLGLRPGIFFFVQIKGVAVLTAGAGID